MNGDDGTALVVGAGEQCLDLQFVDQRAQVVDFAAEIGGDVFAFLRQFEVGVDVVGAASELRLGGERSFQALLLAHDLL